MIPAARATSTAFAPLSGRGTPMPLEANASKPRPKNIDAGFVLLALVAPGREGFDASFLGAFFAGMAQVCPRNAGWVASYWLVTLIAGAAPVNLPRGALVFECQPRKLLQYAHLRVVAAHKNPVGKGVQVEQYKLAV